MKILLDTNITVDILSNREPFCEASVACYENALLRGDKIYISTVSVADVMYLTRKHFADKTEQFKTVFDFIRTIKIAKVSQKDLFFAFSGRMSDFEDAVQAFCAKRHGVKYIITRNVKDYKLSPVMAIEPADFIKLFGNKN
ncbi:MAG: PIN domain-containing protein [Treponema sp.]|nr:PIN domain-containing protein [Treponema sp.]